MFLKEIFGYFRQNEQYDLRYSDLYGEVEYIDRRNVQPADREAWLKVGWWIPRAT